MKPQPAKSNDFPTKPSSDISIISLPTLSLTVLKSPITAAATVTPITTTKIATAAATTGNSYNSYENYIVAASLAEPQTIMAYSATLNAHAETKAAWPPIANARAILSNTSYLPHREFCYKQILKMAPTKISISTQSTVTARSNTTTAASSIAFNPTIFSTAAPSTGVFTKPILAATTKTTIYSTSSAIPNQLNYRNTSSNINTINNKTNNSSANNNKNSYNSSIKIRNNNKKSTKNAFNKKTKPQPTQQQQ